MPGHSSSILPEVSYLSHRGLHQSNGPCPILLVATPRRVPPAVLHSSTVSIRPELSLFWSKRQRNKEWWRHQNVCRVNRNWLSGPHWSWEMKWFMHSRTSAAGISYGSDSTLYTKEWPGTQESFSCLFKSLYEFEDFTILGTWKVPGSCRDIRFVDSWGLCKGSKELKDQYNQGKIPSFLSLSFSLSCYLKRRKPSLGVIDCRNDVTIEEGRVQSDRTMPSQIAPPSTYYFFSFFFTEKFHFHFLKAGMCYKRSTPFLFC